MSDGCLQLSCKESGILHAASKACSAFVIMTIAWAQAPPNEQSAAGWNYVHAVSGRRSH